MTKQDLIEKLSEADAAYYDLEGAEKLSDAEYDALVAAYKELTGENWVRQESGGSQKHSRLMGSLYKLRTREELLGFFPKGARLRATPKIDGLALAITYDRRMLTWALTRGKITNEASWGEPVTGNVLQMGEAIPKMLAREDPIEIRGEVYMPAGFLEEANALRRKKGLPPFKNPRNAAAGILRKESDPAFLRFLRFVAYDAFDPRLPQHEDGTFQSFESKLRWLELSGFDVPPSGEFALETCEPDSLRDFLEALAPELPYNTDGIVLTLDDVAEQRSLGYASRHPRYAAAFKFADERKETELLDIEWEATRTGRVVPTYVFEPVELEGTEVSRATGHNWNNVVTLNAIPGDLVGVYKANMIIPQVEKVTAALMRPEHSLGLREFVPETCPECDHTLDRNEVDLLCPNPSCHAKLVELLQYASNRQNWDVDGMGESLAEALVRSQMVETLADFVLLGSDNELATSEAIALSRLELGEKKIRFGSKRASALLDEIHKARSKPWAVTLHALGCPGLGEPECRQIAQVWSLRDLLNWANCLPEDDDPQGELVAKLVTLKGIGKRTAETFVYWLADNYTWLARLTDGQLRTEAEPPEAPKATTLEGLSFVVTGKHSAPRHVLEELITSNGGIVAGSISKKTSYLVAGSDAGSKLEKAEKAGVKVIDEAALRAML